VDAVEPVEGGEVAVVRPLVGRVGEGDEATRQPDGEADDVDGGVAPVTEQVADRDLRVVLEEREPPPHLVAQRAAPDLPPVHLPVLVRRLEAHLGEGPAVGRRLRGAPRDEVRHLVPDVVLELVEVVREQGPVVRQPAPPDGDGGVEVEGRRRAVRSVGVHGVRRG
jgi:hypothetical protein